jgi:hypothetical protein
MVRPSNFDAHADDRRASARSAPDERVDDLAPIRHPARQHGTYVLWLRWQAPSGSI